MGRGSLILVFLLFSTSLASSESQEARNHYNRGVIYQSQGQAELAISEYRNAIALESEYGWAWGKLCLFRGKISDVTPGKNALSFISSVDRHVQR